MTLDELNACDHAGFIAALGEIFEHAPWVADAIAGQRPFAAVEAVHQAMMQALLAAPEAMRLQVVRNHPELAGKAAQEGDLTADSLSEQGSAGLDRLPPAMFARFGDLNAAYRAKFGFPFLICVRRHTRADILRQFARRLDGAPAEELANALTQIGLITRLRVAARIEGPGQPKVHGRLSTHVLDTVSGRPAAGLTIELRDISEGSAGVLMRRVITNADGRTDAPLIADQPLRIGEYQLDFHVGDYFRSSGVPISEPAFVDVVPIRFGIAEPEGHYHVPLLVSPYAYSTYRGS